MQGKKYYDWSSPDREDKRFTQTEISGKKKREKDGHFSELSIERKLRQVNGILRSVDAKSLPGRRNSMQ